MHLFDHPLVGHFTCDHGRDAAGGSLQAAAAADQLAGASPLRARGVGPLLQDLSHGLGLGQDRVGPPNPVEPHAGAHVLLQGYRDSLASTSGQPLPHGGRAEPTDELA